MSDNENFSSALLSLARGSANGPKSAEEIEQVLAKYLGSHKITPPELLWLLYQTRYASSPFLGHPVISRLGEFFPELTKVDSQIKLDQKVQENFAPKDQEEATALSKSLDELTRNLIDENATDPQTERFLAIFLGARKLLEMVKPASEGANYFNVLMQINGVALEQKFGVQITDRTVLFKLHKDGNSLELVTRTNAIFKAVKEKEINLLLLPASLQDEMVEILLIGGHARLKLADSGTLSSSDSSALLDDLADTLKVTPALFLGRYKDEWTNLRKRLSL